MALQEEGGSAGGTGGKTQATHKSDLAGSAARRFSSCYNTGSSRVQATLLLLFLLLLSFDTIRFCAHHSEGDWGKGKDLGGSSRGELFVVCQPCLVSMCVPSVRPQCA